MRLQRSSLARRRSKRLAPTLIFMLLLVASAHAQNPPATTPSSELRQAHQLILDALNEKDARGNRLALDNPRVPSLVREGWRLAGLWAAAYLNAHPDPSGPDLPQIFSGFAPERSEPKSPEDDSFENVDYAFAGSATRITDSVFVIQATYGAADFPTGTFLVVARGENGHFNALWNIKDVAEKHYSQRDEIGRWMFLTRRSYYSGPLTVDEIRSLPPSSNGHSRFLVKAVSGADGGTILYQLSLWEWTGADALPLLIDSYESVGAGDLHFNGNLIRVETKEFLNALFSCGSCEEPKGFWEIRITPGDVRNLGHHFRKPEYRWADNLLAKVENHESIVAIARPRVAADIRTFIAQNQSSDTPQAGVEGSRFSWGMLAGCRVIRRGDHGSFSISTDDATLTFAYVLRHRQPFFTSVQIAST